MPFYLLNSVKEVIQAEKHHETNAKPACQATALEYRTQATAIAMKTDRQTKRTILKFPKNYRASNTFFNDGLKTKTKYDLYTHARFITQKIETGKDAVTGQVKKMSWTASYVYWKVIVDGTICNTEVVVEADNDDIFMAAMKSMNLNNP
jgi:hypothetical protein